MSATRWRAAAMILAVALAGVGVNALNDQLPPSGALSVTMELGEDADVYPYRFHVHGARAAAAVRDTYDERHDSDGVWVVIDLSYAAMYRQESPSLFGLRDAQGRMYQLSERFSQTPWSVGPDLWMRGELAFEVPRESLGELTFFVWPTGRSSEVTLPDSDAADLPLPYGELALYVDPLQVADEHVMPAEPVLLDEGER